MLGKRWWQSKTIWANVIAFVATMSTAFGLNLGLDANTQGMIVAAVMAVVNVVLRYVTKEPIVSGDGA